MLQSTCSCWYVLVTTSILFTLCEGREGGNEGGGERGMEGGREGGKEGGRGQEKTYSFLYPSEYFDNYERQIISKLYLSSEVTSA